MADIATVERAAVCPPPGGASRVLDGELPEGAVLRSLDPCQDERGRFTEIFKSSWKLPIAPVQWSAVTSCARALRGMYCHVRHDEAIVVLGGSAAIGLFDLRADSATANRSCMVYLCATQPACLTFPAGVVHGWYFFEDSLHLQLVSEEFQDYRTDDNLGCRWSDPALELDWFDPAPIVTRRAAAFGSLDEMRRRVQAPIGDG